MSISKIKKVRIKNFMSIEEDELEFDDSNVIVLKGYNNSGKSAVIKAIEVALFGKYENKQIAFIRDGENFFHIEVVFDDGITLVREKHASGKSLYEMYKGKDLIYTTKQGDAIAKVNGVPEDIQTYVAATTMGEGYLNTANGNEPMLLTDTTGGENFKAISDILKAEELSRALNAVRTDIKENQNEINYLRARRERVEEWFNSNPDIDLIKALKAGINKIRGHREDLGAEKSYLECVAERGERLSGLKVPCPVPRLNGSQARAISAWLELSPRLLDARCGGVTRVRAAGAQFLAGGGAVLRALSAEGEGVSVQSLNNKAKAAELINKAEDVALTLETELDALTRIERDRVNIQEQIDALVKLIEEKYGEESLIKCSNCGKFAVDVKDGCNNSEGR